MLSKNEIIEKAYGLGFDEIGFTTAEPFGAGVSDAVQVRTMKNSLAILLVASALLAPLAAGAQDQYGVINPSFSPGVPSGTEPPLVFRALGSAGRLQHTARPRTRIVGSLTATV